MKKNKKLLLLSLIIFFIQLTVSGAIVEKIVYHTGEDFVQLFFKTNGIVSIPDLFYPQKGNSKFLIMRVSDIEFKENKNLYTFNSPIVKNLKVKKKKGFYDIEITLKEVVNYRVSTSQKGLYIEFPNVKNVFVTKKKNDIKPYSNKKSTLKKKKQFYSKNNKLRGLDIIEKGKNNVKFQFHMSAKNVKHEVIEVNNKPYRLALDFLNTKSNIINKVVNSLNVNKVRGAQNRANVFRVVFDLKSLENFKITTKNNSLFVEFYNNIYKKKFIVKNKKGNKKEILPRTKSIDLAKVKPKKVLSTKIINTPKKEIAKNTKVKEKKPEKKDEYFSEPTSQSSNSEAESFMEIEDENGNVKKGIFTVHGGEPKYKGAPIDINVKNQDLAHLINGFAELAKINIILDPGVTGKVTANLKKVPWDQALELFLKTNGLGKVIEGNILRIGKISVLANESKQIRAMQMAKAAVEEMVVKNYTVSYAKAGELSTIIKAQLSPRGKLYVDARTNTLIITDIIEKINLIDSLIEVLDTPTTQVSIEAKIIETNINYYNALGVQWGYNIIADATHGNPTSLKFPNSIGVRGNVMNKADTGVANTFGTGGYAINMPAPAFDTASAITFGNVADTFRLDLALTAMESSGKGKILSSPKTTTQNNLKAVINQGSKIPIQTTVNNTIKVQYVNAVLELDVTPQITAKGTIKLDIKIKNDNPDWTNQVNGVPPLSTQSITTTIMAKDGETIVIGGMYKIEDSQSGNKVPLLSKIPIIGSLFRNKIKTGARKEILIFVTARIVK